MAEQLRFGVAVTPGAHDPAAMTELAQAADRAGLDLIAVQDHPYQPGHLDTWTALTHLGARTERIGLLTDVADLALRPAPMLAKAAASLDVLTSGRVELGVGSGGFPDAVAGMGGHAVRGGQAVEFTAEALALLRAALDADGPIGLDGRHHRVGGYQPGPVPPHRVPVWVGAQGPRMLGLIGELADGWICPLNIYVPPEEVPAKQALIDRAAVAAGRGTGDVRRLYNVLGLIGGGHRGKGLFGPAEVWAQTLAGWARELRFDTFVFWPAMSELDQLQRFTEEVVPRVRELVRG
ncbi:LLM class flavin-dependent oxidoreductase [Catellatospora bangladeshensis]|uniref:Luciferase-like domain-containing protein n=1 Tax=Catellatospora bangladeshensis TaxID=310355 RepID=A0A8J3JP85_9ACTN|nr:LLM class flavin-dependent oxidoreductase [Catellatospora bangladeshensis]GIF84218.1 hypothetical protein Cba03nite_55670 [Catellatospora bangladeshensis]